MELSEQRLIASLILLLGVSFLIVGLLTNQLDRVLKMVQEILKSTIAGVP